MMAALSSQKMEGFCLSIISGKSQSDAYRDNYSCSNQKPASIHRNAKALMDNIKIISRLEELREPARKAAGLTLESHLSTLERIRDLALAENQFSAATTAETNRGKASGLYTEKVDLNSKMTVVFDSGDQDCL